MAENDDILTEFIENSLYRLDESTRMNAISVAALSETDIWKRFNAHSNSVGNLILHICGNMTQYVVSSLGETQDTRERDLEFSRTSGGDKKQLMERLTSNVQKAKDVISKATPEQWLRKRNVQGYHFSGIGCVLHAVEHYSYHTGQIAFWTKQLKNKKLGFYQGVDLNLRNIGPNTKNED